MTAIEPRNIACFPQERKRNGLYSSVLDVVGGDGDDSGGGDSDGVVEEDDLGEVGVSLDSAARRQAKI